MKLKKLEDINDDSINKFFKFFLATKSKNFISPTSNIIQKRFNFFNHNKLNIYLFYA